MRVKRVKRVREWKRRQLAKRTYRGRNSQKKGNFIFEEWRLEVKKSSQRDERAWPRLQRWERRSWQQQRRTRQSGNEEETAGRPDRGRHSDHAVQEAEERLGTPGRQRL